ncbi:hypothetical protein EDC04DRAFT_2612194 [Pisolithus marmoratus]|nr:hypothetical protein EDC04DRAFT_2612194 [Pisolithus marmoratus]
MPVLMMPDYSLCTLLDIPPLLVGTIQLRPANKVVQVLVLAIMLWANHMKKIAWHDPDGMGDTNAYSSSHEQTALPLQRTKQSTAGQGGAIVQLGKNTITETHTEDSGIEPTDITTGPQPKFQRAKPGARFSFQAEPSTQCIKPQRPLPPQAQGQTTASQATATAQHASQQPGHAVLSHPQPLSTIPEVPSALSISDVAASQTPLSSLLKKLTGKFSLKPSQAAQQVIHPSPNAFQTNGDASDDLSEPNFAEEPHNSDGGDNRWSFPPANEELNGHDDDLCLGLEEMDVGPHKPDDELDNHFGTPSPQQCASPLPQTHSQQSSSQQQPPQLHLHTQPIASSQHIPLEKSVPWHIASMWSGPTPQQSQPQAAPNCAQDHPLSHSLGQHQESVSSNQSVLIQDHRVQSNGGPHQCGNEQIGMDYNVNAGHHSRNHHPHPPSPETLEDMGNHKKHCSKKPQSNVAKDVQDDVNKEGNCSGGSSNLVSEHHVEMVIKYEEDGLELEAAQEVYGNILFNNMQTFCSGIKKATICIVPFEYCLYPPKNIKDNGEHLEFIKKAVQLLKGVLVKVQNVLMTFKKHGVIKNEMLCGEEVDDTYHNLISLVDQVWHNDYHGNKLERMLWEWTRAGM